MKLKKIYRCGKRFFSNPKSFLLGPLLMASFSGRAENTDDDSQGIIKEVIVSNNDSIPDDVIDLTEAFADISVGVPTDTIATDSVSPQSFDAMQRIVSLSDDAVYVIAQFEGVKCRAYADKNARGLPTIGIGNTIHANGRKVRLGDCLRSEKELIECVKVHIAERIAPIMSRNLDIEHMGDAQIVSLIDLAYNCGAGVFEKNGQPTELSKNLNDFVQTGGEQSLQKLDRYFKMKVIAGGKRLPALEKRRAAEFRMFAKNDANLLQACREARLGVMYSIKPQAIREDQDLPEQLKRCTVGYNLSDTISRQINTVPLQSRQRGGRK